MRAYNDLCGVKLEILGSPIVSWFLAATSLKYIIRPVQLSARQHHTTKPCHSMWHLLFSKTSRDDLLHLSHPGTFKHLDGASKEQRLIPHWANPSLSEKSSTPLYTHRNSCWIHLPVTDISQMRFTGLCLCWLDDRCCLGCIQPILTIYLVLLVSSLPQGSLTVTIKVHPFGERKVFSIRNFYSQTLASNAVWQTLLQNMGKKCYRNANNFSCLYHIQLLILWTKGTKSDFRISMVKA